VAGEIGCMTPSIDSFFAHSGCVDGHGYEDLRSSISFRNVL